MSTGLKTIVENIEKRSNESVILTNGVDHRLYIPSNNQLVKLNIHIDKNAKVHDGLYIIRIFSNNIDEYIKNFEDIMKMYKITNKCRYRMSHLQLLINYSLLQKSEKTNGKIECDELDEYEKEFIKDTSAFFIIYGNKKKDKKTVSYDINSFYPYCMQSYKFLFKKGIMINIRNMDELEKCSYYYVKVKVDVDTMPFYYKVTNNVLWLTNFDIYTFVMSGTKFELVDGMNCYYYGPIQSKYENVSKIHSNINKLYKLKNVSPTHKMCLKSMHGVIFGSEKIREQIPVLDENGEQVKTIDIDTMEEIDLMEDKKREVKIFRNIIGHRNYSFFYAYTRYTMFKKYIKPVLDAGIKIDRVYCDSITCAKNDVLDKMIGPNIGQMKYE